MKDPNIYICDFIESRMNKIICIINLIDSAIGADLKTELRWLLEGHNLKANDSHYIKTTDKRLQE